MAQDQIEIWRPIVGFEAYYEVSDLGRVRSLPKSVWVSHPSGAYEKRLPPKLRKPYKNAGSMDLNLNPGKVKRKVHHLVLETFVGIRPVGLVTRHLNGDFTDNRLVNLEYGTQSENRFDSVRHDRHKVPRSLVGEIRQSTLSSRVAARTYGVSRSYVRLVRSGGTRTIG